MSHSTALRLCYALRLEHRRCALWLGDWNQEQWQIQSATEVAPPRCFGFAST
ncbi:MAG: hypothetical protein K2N70_07390 [Helicobacter sp.]|nr:hypothetical protein [Helicobacter sp.]